ncbi:MAG: hypothetical protein KIS67_26440 [Verrucomicrobiae bacterium]|nr:hypothetical protein [Verrucomicrobiae bacterium]
MTRPTRAPQDATKLPCRGTSVIAAVQHGARLTLGVGFLALATTLHANDAIDPSRLPPPANVAVDFDRDVKPIFAESCLRCHGPERPRSRFRLDNHHSALRGGDLGVDILPGDSANSPLIHYVTGVIEEMQMPPAGHGEPLTAEQVGLLRAWIDQGAHWGEGDALGKAVFSISPTFRWLEVSGNRNKFRELEGMKEGWVGGIEHFEYADQFDHDRRLSVGGRVLFEEHETRINLTLEQTDFGFIRAGAAQWRSWYDDTGGYYRPFVPPTRDLNRELHLEHERAWIDLGLTLPHWPRLVLGYEFQSREGDKSTLQWGTVTQPGSGSRNIYPSAKGIEERTHIIKFDLTHEVSGWRIEDSARVEFYDLHTHRDLARMVVLGPTPNRLERVHERASHIQGANSIRVEKQLREWWLGSAGYFYSRFDGDSQFRLATLDAAQQPVFGRHWRTEDIVLRRESHVASLTSLFLPLDVLSASLGFQSEWTRQEGFGNIHLDSGNPNVPASFLLEPATIRADLDKSRTMENASLRFTAIPRTVVFAEARLEQESLGQFETTAGETSQAFLRDTDATNDRRDWRAGFHVSPWRWVSFNTHYRDRFSDSDYDHRRDIALLGEGYSAFILRRKIEGQEVEAKLVLRPARWLKTTLTYQLLATDYVTVADGLPGEIAPGGRVFAGNYDAQLYGLNLLLTPWQRFYFSGTFNYGESRTATADNQSPGVVAYRGETFNTLISASYVLNPATHLHTTYSFTRADFGQPNVATGLPLGLDFTRHGLMAGVTRKLTESLSATVRYGYYQYDEPTRGGANDYAAHGVFVSMNYHWP